MQNKWLAVLAALLCLAALTGCRKNVQSPETTAATSGAQGLVVPFDQTLLDRSGTEAQPQTAQVPSAEPEQTHPAKQNTEQSQTVPVQTPPSQSKPAEGRPQQTEPAQKETVIADAETVPAETVIPDPDTGSEIPEPTFSQPDAETVPGSVELGLGGLPLAPE